ncbi:hypothetical protein AVEN_182142-1 [Araneus ventricosus]|uniref:Uncharacterized protein n=1 Tax=Araneus ventricosus TaxID=182803 RepID=A0A4Y2GND6_ARAVE|nr:hypothetical protein AVEN_182142-1 [Araneus ventricosus]
MPNNTRGHPKCDVDFALRRDFASPRCQRCLTPSQWAGEAYIFDPNVDRTTDRSRKTIRGPPDLDRPPHGQSGLINCGLSVFNSLSEVWHLAPDPLSARLSFCLSSFLDSVVILSRKCPLSAGGRKGIEGLFFYISSLLPHLLSKYNRSRAGKG